MSYKTSHSSGFPPINKPTKRVTQEFTAIQVDDPSRHELPRTPPQEPQVVRVTVPDNGSSAKLDSLVARQDQLLDHQIKVSNRQEELASQMASQNNAMNQALLQQILQNRDSVVANMARMQSSAEWDEHSKDLLAQHIKYMVAIIQRLNHDIEGLEAELRGRDIAVIGTNKAVNKIEVHHVTMLQDLRGRIVRCDTAIAKHTKDIMMLMDELRALEGQIHNARERTLNDIHRLEAEVMSMTGELERQTGEQRTELAHLRSETKHRLGMLEDQQRTHHMELRDAMEGQKANFEHMLERMDKKFQAMIDKATSGWSGLMDQVDRKIEQNMMSLLSRLKKVEDSVGRDRANMQQLQHVDTKSIENQVMATIKEAMSYNNAEITRAKMEFRNGFTELQESLANMKRVVEGRRKILANQMKKEIGQVKKAMYIELPSQQEANTIVYRNVDKSNDW